MDQYAMGPLVIPSLTDVTEIPLHECLISAMISYNPDVLQN
jgi:hypothetical protein